MSNGSTKTTVKNKAKTGYAKMYKVLLHNDNVHTLEAVVQALMIVFHFEQKQAFKIAMEAHTSSVALCTTEAFEQAEFHMEQLKTYSLVSTIEPE